MCRSVKTCKSMLSSRSILRDLTAAMLVLGLCSGCVTTEGKNPAAGVPNLTKVVPPDLCKVQNLGPTGLKGWMHVDMVERVPGDMSPTPLTVNARQIYVTHVAEGSPADGLISVGDVILGIGDKPFAGDPRVALADAINEAEKKENGGSLRLLLWHPDEPDAEGAKQRSPGKSGVIELKLAVLGTYSDTAPYNCEKSEAILKQTVEAMVKRGMNRKLELPYLALLATGEEEYFEIVKEHVKTIAASVPEPGIEAVNNARSWGTGYRLILLCEYYLLTKDETVLPAIEKTAVTLSMGQGIGGTWGHAMAQPSYNDGRLHGRIEGYADLNQPSLTCFMGLVLAEKCGVQHPELTTALKKANAFFRRNVGKGAIPYGNGPPKEYLQSNNGTSGSAAIAFSLKGDRAAAKFFSVMSAGAHTKLEVGHTGPFFCTMWTGLGANVAGPDAYSEFFKRWTWMRTLNRQWDGGYAYQTPGGGDNDYRGLSADAAMILHFALPRRKLLITGRDQDQSIWLKGKDAVAAADIWTIDYKAETKDQLLKRLDHDVPMVRMLAASELASRADVVPENLKPLLNGSYNEKIGACNALAEMKEKSAPVLDALMEIVRDEGADAWLRSRATRAIAATGEAGLGYTSELLGLLLVDRKSDPLREYEPYAAEFLANMVNNESFDYEKHKDVVSRAVLRLMRHPHIVARRDGISMIENVSLQDFPVFADAIVEVINNSNPDYTTYSGDKPARVALGILERLNIEDGIELAIDTMRPGMWGYGGRVLSSDGRAALLKKYGGEAVKPHLPKLREALAGKNEDKITEIMESKVARELITLQEAKKQPSRARMKTSIEKTKTQLTSEN